MTAAGRHRVAGLIAGADQASDHTPAVTGARKITQIHLDKTEQNRYKQDNPNRESEDGMAEKKKKDEPQEAPVIDTAAVVNRPLYEIAGEYLEIVDALVEAGGEMTDENVALWDGIRGAVAEKLENCALMVTAFDANSAMLQGEIKRLQDRKRLVGNAKDWLKKYITTV